MKKKLTTIKCTLAKPKNCDHCGCEKKKNQIVFAIWDKKQLVCSECWKKYKKDEEENEKGDRSND